MWGMAARLSDPTIDGWPPIIPAQPPAAGGGRGNGGGREDLPRGRSRQECAAPAWQCHGEKAEGNGAIPRLAGQHRSYLEGQLEAFAVESRANEIMHENSKNLTAEQISQVAAYLAAQ